MSQDAPVPTLPPEDKRRLQNAASVASKRLDHLSGPLAAFHADTKSRSVLEPGEALRRAEEILTDMNHLALGVRDIVRAARTAYREAEVRRSADRL